MLLLNLIEQQHFKLIKPLTKRNDDNIFYKTQFSSVNTIRYHRRLYRIKNSLCDQNGATIVQPLIEIKNKNSYNDAYLNVFQVDTLLVFSLIPFVVI